MKVQRRWNSQSQVCHLNESTLKKCMMMAKCTCPVDVLRRAKVEVTVVGVELASDIAVCSRGVKIAPDVKFNESLKAVSC